MGKIEINYTSKRHFSDGTRQMGVHIADLQVDTLSGPCSAQAWSAVVLAASGSVAQFRAALVSAFGETWVDSLPEYEPPPSGVLVMARLMLAVSTL
jgi:hypothetical protein